MFNIIPAPIFLYLDTGFYIRIGYKVYQYY